MTDPEGTIRKLRDYHNVECKIITDILVCSALSIIEDRSFALYLGADIIMEDFYEGFTIPIRQNSV